MKMDDNDLEVLDCSESPRETPEPSEQTSNIAVDLVAYNIYTLLVICTTNPILNIIYFHLIL